jgi:hypothetical protein
MWPPLVRLFHSLHRDDPLRINGVPDQGGAVRRRNLRSAAFLLSLGLSAVVGMFLLIFGAASMWSLGRWNNRTGNLVEASFFLLWATSLLCFAGFSIVEAIRPKALLPTAQVK